MISSRASRALKSAALAETLGRPQIVQACEAQLFRYVRLSAVVVVGAYGHWKSYVATESCAAETKRLQIGLGSCLRERRVDVGQKLAKSAQSLSTDLL